VGVLLLYNVPLQNEEVHAMTRTTQEVFDAHMVAIDTGDFEKLIADYADDAVMLTFDGASVGKKGIAGFFQNTFSQFPNLRLSVERTAVEGDMVLLEWSAVSDVGTGRGMDTFVIRDGEIQRQTVWMEVFPKTE
jgi:predicted SnoaL-like aldol condensation-catalyzing enzyme